MAPLGRDDFRGADYAGGNQPDDVAPAALLQLSTLRARTDFFKSMDNLTRPVTRSLAED
jgi:hypothetical protein